MDLERAKKFSKLIKYPFKTPSKASMPVTDIDVSITEEWWKSTTVAGDIADTELFIIAVHDFIVLPKSGFKLEGEVLLPCPIAYIIMTIGDTVEDITEDTAEDMVEDTATDGVVVRL